MPRGIAGMRLHLFKQPVKTPSVGKERA